MDLRAVTRAKNAQAIINHAAHTGFPFRTIDHAQNASATKRYGKYPLVTSSHTAYFLKTAKAKPLGVALLIFLVFRDLPPSLLY